LGLCWFASDDPLANAGRDRLGSSLLPRPAVIVRAIYPIDKSDLDILQLLHFLTLALLSGRLLPSTCA
jgi:hypothetical protein